MKERVKIGLQKLVIVERKISFHMCSLLVLVEVHIAGEEMVVDVVDEFPVAGFGLKFSAQMQEM
jgi:hypothetical protein